MNDTVRLVLAGGAGGVFGVIFFGGLWWTVRKGLSSKRPALWFLGSLLLRTGIVLTGFYLISGGRGERLLACLLGFVAARFIVTHRLRPPLRPQAPVRQAGPPMERSMRPAREVSHAP